ncbi:MarR family winged helix-turn-helix transcriptional regulator [Mangrovibacillus cuniculi]|uniref:MarR family transcriptional regulator n=1 Tax=Mangrovibacillus cuniculi TaxID=2593652 RepID=A0A7S8HF79_9BACI|nr:MarR family transcriptional regulator [Mangrovibacillus cuniculi]QPC46145.1 MarR family transcriptional regulator [Mangrovibacillus cuniculi]
MTTENSLKLFIVLSKATKAIHEYQNKYIQQAGLNPTEFAVLELLYHKGDQPLQKIGSKILIASGSITYVVDKLEQKEFVERIACPNDRRVTFAHITESGKAFIDEIFPAHSERLDEIFSVITEEEKQAAITILKKVGISARDKS